MSNSILGPITRISIPERAEAFDPHQFGQDRQGLSLFNGLWNLELPVAQKIESLPAQDVVWQDLLKDANDEQIRAELSAGHVFENAGTCLARLDTIIERQSNGAAGDLLINGCANIFYARAGSGKVCAVRVR